MDDNIKNPASQAGNSKNREAAKEKSKKRAAELKALDSEKIAPEHGDEQKQLLEAAIVEELNKTVAIIHTSSTYILIEKSEMEFVLDSKTSFLTLYENQIVPELAGDSKRPPTKAQIWIKSSNRRTFKNIVFNPKIAGHYDGNFNIWKGFAVQPIQGDCSLFWDHVEKVICSGKKEHYLYVRRWLAHLIQKPWVIATALILRGKQGIGKGTFVDAIGTLLGPHYAPLASLDQILGRFNSHLKSAILVYADEAIWEKNKKAIGILKAFITESKFFIEAKGRDGYWVSNFKHLIVSSNEDHAVHLDPDDRRFFVLDVPDTHKEDFPYFKKITNQLKNGGYQALMYDLLYEDLSEFDPKIMPENFAGFDMKLASTSSIDRFIHASLKEECWDHANGGFSSEWKDMRVDQFYDHYKKWCEKEKQTILRKEEVGRRLKAIIPGVKTKRSSREENSARPTVYAFSSLEECRGAFEKFYKQSPAIWDWS